jgi:4-diphosphocytidyl-2-C-methyl-D-erythritol kinase
MATDAITEFAPAKINLCLHVTGRRADGYHLLDSLVVFAQVGDRVSVAPGSGLSLRVTGPERKGLQDDADNLVVKAARTMELSDAALILHKNLPVAAGIGGGSADAAATLRAISRLTGRALPGKDAVLRLGADVPVCLAGRPARMEGIGEVLTTLPALPTLWCVLVNPRLPLSTPQVFKMLTTRQSPPLPDLPTGRQASAPGFATWLADHTRNDLVAPARQVAPLLGEVQAALEATAGCLLARMSGAGGTHFGLFERNAAAETAAAAIRAARPGWWVATARIRD